MLNHFDGTYVGYLIDGRDDTPHVVGMLTINHDKASLEVPLLSGQTDVYESEWFKDSTLPEELLFRNQEVSFSLTDIAFNQYNTALGGAHGTGILTIGRVVETGTRAPSYQSFHGLRSEIVGLSTWLAPRSFIDTFELTEQHRLRSATFTIEKKPNISVEGVEGLSLCPSFTISHSWSNGVHSMTERMTVETRFPDPGTWWEHAQHHRALQDLISLSYWWACDADVDAVLREDDPATSIADTSHGEEWRHAQVTGFGRRTVRDTPPDLPSKRRPLFTYDDIGAAGLAKWYADYQDLGQAMWVLSSSLFRHGGTVEVRLLQVGVALEALGYELAIRSGRLRKDKRDRSFTLVKALTTIAESVDCSLRKVLRDYPDIATWAAAFNKAYIGVKHADNALPTAQDSSDRAAEGALLARLWLARHLGMSREALEAREHAFYYYSG